MLNPALNIEQLQQVYRINQAISIQNALEPEYAHNLHQAIKNLDWCLEINDYHPGDSLKVPLRELANPAAPLLNILDQVEHGLDRDKLFFMRLKVDGVDFHDPVLEQFSAFLNSEQFLGPMRQIVGMEEITHCWMEATGYRSCCFLGGHRDDHHASNRAAFVFNLTPEWQLDWGGLLLLVNPNTQPTIVPPQWNSLSMFTVPRDHLVTVVSPGTTATRYSITGWLRNDPA